MVLLAYVAVVFMVQINWVDVVKGIVLPRFPVTTESMTVIVAILGTTISPYLMFWQSSQEVEEIDKEPSAQPLADSPEQAPREFVRIQARHVCRHGGFQSGRHGHHDQHGSHSASSRQDRNHKRS